MAELSIVGASVLAGANADFYQGIAGQAITAGQACYYDALSNRLRLADANASKDSAAVMGIALHQAAANQPLRVQTRGTLTVGIAAGVTTATVYVVGGNPGGIAPVADKAAGWWTSLIGVGNSSAGLELSLFPSGYLS